MIGRTRCKDLCIHMGKQWVMGGIIFITGVFGILDIHFVIFMGCETIGIEIPESLDGRGKVSVGIG